MRVTVLRVDNGYLLSWRNDRANRYIVEEKGIFDDTDECHREMLWALLEALEVYGSKHHKRRLTIVWKDNVTGDLVDGDDKYKLVE